MNSATQEWGRLLSTILGLGHTTAPRGLPCLEVIGHQSRVDMMRPIVVCPARKLSYRFMCGEAWWIMSGRNDAESISRYAKNIARYSDNGTSFFGAYGPALHEQLDYAVESIARDPDTRQAVVNIWRERPPATKDVPCTLSWQWLVRGDHIHCNATMRSSDAWLGWVYDVFNFSMVTWLLAQRLWQRGKLLQPGQLTLTAGSQHLYLSDQARVDAVLSTSWGESPKLSLGCLAPEQLVYQMRLAADQQWEDLQVLDSPLQVFQELSKKA